MKNFKHLMLGIETKGTKPYSVILSIGAVEFDINTGDTGLEFHKHIDIMSSVNKGLKIDPKTVLWWIGGGNKSKEGLLGAERYPIEEVLCTFSEFCHKDYQVWANSPSFDCSLLANAYDVLGSEIPWDFRKERSVRILSSFAPEIKNSLVRTGVEHDALSNCKFQIKHCCELWKFLNKM